MKKSIVLISCMICLQAFGNDNFELTSPSGSIRAAVKCDSTLTWSVETNGIEILTESPVSMTLVDGRKWGHDAKVKKAHKESISRTIDSPLTYTSEMEDNYNGLLLEMKGDWNIEFRAYDDAVAYRFISSQKKP
ncbi:glycoside hydrolase family 97 N-terminal domain-containing protein, partial [uncultured Duncaniella sp.]|uniref:glycoside hydrolase family 97 N-terminal domain-containing protein n=1 Tax=uncultured Duncaniella sp. TaxID=2768039 RepID=UPI0026E5826D